MDREVELQVGERTYVLTITLDAMRKINRQFGSITDAAHRVARYDFDAIAFIVTHGAGLTPKQSEQMQREIVGVGLVKIIPKVTEYVGILLDPEGHGEEGEGGEPGEA